MVDNHRFVEFVMALGNGVAESLVGLQWRKDDSSQLDCASAELAGVSLARKRFSVEEKRQWS